MSILNQLQEGLEIIFLTGTRCKNPFHICKIELQKKTKWSKKMAEKSAIRGDGGPLPNGKSHETRLSKLCGF